MLLGLIARNMILPDGLNSVDLVEARDEMNRHFKFKPSNTSVSARLFKFGGFGGSWGSNESLIQVQTVEHFSLRLAGESRHRLN